MGNVHDPAIIAPMQYEEVDIGETLPARCLRGPLAVTDGGHTVCPATEPGRALWTDKWRAFGNRSPTGRKGRGPVAPPAEGS
jgi:hypothetical protein